jgi:prepilin-type N-terminal cleavage/methylation domain-containing protein
MRSQKNRNRAERSQCVGFSLIELLIVVAIILIIASIAIPNLLRARIAANEASAASSVRKIATAEVTYAAAYPTIGFANVLSDLGGPAGTCTPTSTSACILDSVLTSGSKSGYSFTALGFGGTPNSTFVAGGAPQSFDQTGVRNFCIATDGVLRSLNTNAATPPPATVNACVAYPTAQ